LAECNIIKNVVVFVFIVGRNILNYSIYFCMWWYTPK